MARLKIFLTHYVLYFALLLLLCVGIFPFVIFYAGSTSIAELLDRFSSGKSLSGKLEKFWTVIGIPYDYLVTTVG